MTLKKQVLQELQNTDFSNLHFLYSPEVLEVSQEILEELLEKEKQDFEEKISKKYKGLDPESSSGGHNTGEITFETFDDFSELGYFFGLLEHYQGVNNDEVIRKIIEDFEPKYIEFGNEISYSKRYYDMLVYSLQQLTKNLTPTLSHFDKLSEQEREKIQEQMRILEMTIEAYEVRGIALPKDKQEQLKKINLELSELTQKFGNNVLDSQKAFSYIITDESIICEMPEDDKQVARKKAEEKYSVIPAKAGINKTVEVPSKDSESSSEGQSLRYLFDASGNAYMSIMKYCSDASVRKDFYEARNKFATQEPHNNKKVILEILGLRNKKATLLGFKNYAELSLHFKMAENPEQIETLFAGITEKARLKAQKELDEIREYFSLGELDVWDMSYYARKLREQKYALDDKELKKYFEFERVLEGMFEVVKKLYKLEIKEITDIVIPAKNNVIPAKAGINKKDKVPLQSDGFLPSQEGQKEESGGNKNNIFSDIQVYEVSRNGKFLSYFFTDFFYRPLKRQGAWANILRENYNPPITSDIPLIKGDGGGFKKIVVNVGNFQKAADGKTLLTLSDVETMFHEFGHATHEMLSVSEHSELSGFNVEWDFVELPSQLLENWCRHPDGLKLFARHYETGADMPTEMIQTLQKLETFGTGNMILKQNEYATLDILLHSQEIPKTEQELDTKIHEINDICSIFPRPEVYSPHTSFSHIFDGGYAAGYYSYMWAEVIEKEVWKVFLDSGDIYSPEVAQKFHDTILSQGTTKKASELFRDFMGREVEIDAFLSEKGLK